MCDTTDTEQIKAEAIAQNLALVPIPRHTNSEEVIKEKEMTAREKLREQLEDMAFGSEKENSKLKAIELLAKYFDNEIICPHCGKKSRETDKGELSEITISFKDVDDPKVVGINSRAKVAG